MKRRTFLKAAGASGTAALLAGCTGASNSEPTTAESGGGAETT
ncbi:twin-arginine translocation signal domain-containing protein, partial [Haloferax profundi]